MKTLLAVILAAALAWSGYWAWGARQAKAEVGDWITARTAEGWQADVGDIALAGYPNRFDLTLTDIDLVDPDTGLGWQAAFFQLFQLSYQPGHLIAIWPNQQTLIWPGGRAQIDSDQMQASVVLANDEAGTLERMSLVADVLNIASDAGSAAFASVQLATRQVGPADKTWQISMTADGFAPALPAAIAALPATFDALSFDANVQFDRAWDLSALRDQRPQPTMIDVSLAQAAWGPMALKATGTLTVDAQGVPSGDLALQVRNWRDMLDLARASGQVPNAVLAGIEQGLTLLARMNGSGASLDLTLTFEEGRMFAGPVPLGHAPVFRLR